MAVEAAAKLGAANRSEATAKKSTGYQPLSFIDLPESIRTDAVFAAWQDWEQHRREKRVRLTPLALKKQLAEMFAWGPERSVAAIEFSIAKGYTGLIEPKGNANGNGSKHNGHRGTHEGLGFD